MAPDLEPDVARLLATLGLEALGVEMLSRSRERMAWRIRLRDGRTVKARRLSRAHKTGRFVRLVRALDDDRLPRILGDDGRVSVEEWVEGTPLSELPLAPERLAAAADLLGSLHARRALGGRRFRGPASTAPLRRRARAQLARLATAGALERHAAAALAGALLRAGPPRAPRGLTHTDFCAENLVEDAQRRLFVVDNEVLQIGFPDYDLARTWYRWPMPAAAWQAFLARYANWRAPDAAAFWRIAALAKGACVRLFRGYPGLAEPIARLVELAGEL